MPAPNWIPPKKKTKEIKTERISTRTTRTKGKKGKETLTFSDQYLIFLLFSAGAASRVRDSDVIVQNAIVTTIDLSDTDDSGSEKAQKEEPATRR